jgi:hypothetical protein
MINIIRFILVLWLSCSLQKSVGQNTSHPTLSPTTAPTFTNGYCQNENNCGDCVSLGCYWCNYFQDLNSSLVDFCFDPNAFPYNPCNEQIGDTEKSISNQCGGSSDAGKALAALFIILIIIAAIFFLSIGVAICCGTAAVCAIFYSICSCFNKRSSSPPQVIINPSAQQGKVESSPMHYISPMQQYQQQPPMYVVGTSSQGQLQATPYNYYMQSGAGPPPIQYATASAALTQPIIYDTAYRNGQAPINASV